MKFIIVLFLFVISASCAKNYNFSEFDIKGSQRALSYTRDPSMADPNGIKIVVNEKGQMLITSRSNDGLETNIQLKLNKQRRIELWNSVDAVQPSQWEKEYEIGLDSKIYKIELLKDNELIQSTRYSADAPIELKKIVTLLEQYAKDEISK